MPEADPLHTLFSLRGRVALVTGGARGLGFEIALALGGAGAAVHVNGTDAARADAAVARLIGMGIDAYASVFDVADEAAADAALGAIFAQHGRLDILVNNVGVRFRQPIDAIDGDHMRRLLDVNLVAAYSLSKTAAALMRRNGHGRILNISSIAAERGHPGDIAYIIAKGAMNAMTRGLAAEFAPDITCNAILPGPFTTETNAESFAGPGMAEFFRNAILLKRPGNPPEIGGAALFLASPAGSFVTGVCLPVDGGYLAAG